jgi:tRNA 2-thiouridine synthesizing protein A
LKEDPDLSLQITTVDARGLACPVPIVMSAQVLRSMPSGALLELIATDPGSVKDVEAWSKTTGNELVEQSVDGGIYRFVVRRK